MNMNKKSQTLIWREKNKTAQSRSNGFWLHGCLALTSTPGQETFISNSRNDDSKQSPCFVFLLFKRNAQSKGPRLVVTWRQAAIIPHLKCRVFKMCFTGKLLMGVTHHIASTKPRSVHQQSLFSANQHPPDGTSKSVWLLIGQLRWFRLSFYWFLSEKLWFSVQHLKGLPNEIRPKGITGPRPKRTEKWINREYICRRWPD